MLINAFLLQVFGLNCLWWLLLAMLIPLLLGLLLGYWLWYQYKRRVAEVTVERDKYHQKFTDMEANYAGMKYKHDEVEKDNKALRASLNSVQADLAILRSRYEKLQAEQQEAETERSAPVAQERGMATSPPSKPKQLDYSALFNPDNLQVIEGIGPKIEKALKKADYRNWSDIAEASPESIAAAMEKADLNHRIHNPATWPQQARLAKEGNWEDLIEFQKSLDTGRTEVRSLETPSKVQQLAAKILGFSASRPDDLKIVEGIGPKIEQLLKDAGINTWSDLANTSEERLKEILEAAGDRYRLAKPSTWPEQARLAQAGAWDELKEYQDFLQGGNDPGEK